MKDKPDRAAIFAVPAGARGLRGLLFSLIRWRVGIVPGIVRVLMFDFFPGLLTAVVYFRINLGAKALTSLQREMLATVVNGKVGGAP